MKLVFLLLGSVHLCTAAVILSTDGVRVIDNPTKFPARPEEADGDGEKLSVACTFDPNGDVYVTVDGAKRDADILKADVYGLDVKKIYMTRDGHVYRSYAGDTTSLIAKPQRPGVGPYRFVVTESARLKIVDSTDTDVWSHPPYREVSYSRDSNVPFIYNGETYLWDRKANLRIDESGVLLASRHPHLDRYDVIKSTLTKHSADERLLVIGNPFGHTLYNSHGSKIWNVDDMFSMHFDRDRYACWNPSDRNNRYGYMSGLKYRVDQSGPVKTPAYKYRAKTYSNFTLYHERMIDANQGIAVRSAVAEVLSRSHDVVGYREQKFPKDIGGRVWVDSSATLTSEQRKDCFDTLLSYITDINGFDSIVTVWYKRDCHFGYVLNGTGLLGPASIFDRDH